MAGQDPEAFPRVTFREAAVIIEAAMTRDARTAWLAAQYSRYAFHDPNDMPADPVRAPRDPETTGAADRAYVRAWMKSLANRSTHGG